MSFFARWDECSQSFIREDTNEWSADGIHWKPRIGDLRMARKKKEEQAEIEVLEALAEEVYPDQVVRPAHYVSNLWEVWDVLDEFFPNKPLLWNVGKYLLRAGKKGDYLEQLQKARQYLDREISKERVRRGLKP